MRTTSLSNNKIGNLSLEMIDGYYYIIGRRWDGVPYKSVPFLKQKAAFDNMDFKWAVWADMSPLNKI